MTVTSSNRAQTSARLLVFGTLALFLSLWAKSALLGAGSSNKPQSGDTSAYVSGSRKVGSGDDCNDVYAPGPGLGG